jgi:hypothetical protein
LAEQWACIPKVIYRFNSHRGQAYFSSLPGVDTHSGTSQKYSPEYTTPIEQIKKYYIGGKTRDVPETNTGIR